MLFKTASSLVLFCLSGPRDTTHHRLSSVVDKQEEVVVPEKYNKLLEWLRSIDEADINDKLVIRPSSRGGGFGAFVTADCVQDEILFSIPRSACITLADATEDPDCGETFQKLMEKAGPGGNTVVMAGYTAKEYLLLQEDLDKGKEELSQFGPYLMTLPWARGVNNQEHILFWGDEEVESLLKGSLCYPEAKDLRSEVDLAIRVLNGIVSKPVRKYRGEEEEDGFSWPWQTKAPTTETLEGLPEAVKGAFVSLLTRSFQDGESDEEKLVPMLDMLQHSDEPNVRHAMRTSDGTVEVRARRDLQAGEELLNQYRSEEEESMPYHRFFTRFGFVPGITEPITNLLEDRSSIFYPQKAEV